MITSKILKIVEGNCNPSLAMSW